MTPSFFFNDRVSLLVLYRVWPVSCAKPVHGLLCFSGLHPSLLQSYKRFTDVPATCLSFMWIFGI